MAMTIDELNASVQGQTLATAFLRTVDSGGTRLALRERGPGGEWVERTFVEYADEVARVCTSLRAAGVGPGDRVVLMMRNVAEFHIVDMAAVFCGATPISIYNSSSPDQIAYLAGHCEAKVAVVEDDGFLERFLKVREELPDLGEIVNLADDGRADIVRRTRHGRPDRGRRADHPGRPRHGHLHVGHHRPAQGRDDHATTTCVYTGESLRRCFGADVDLAGKRVVSYLPMAHIAERMTSHYSHAIAGLRGHVLSRPGQLAGYLREVRPNILFGVPRVWEKLHAGVTAALAADPEKKAQFDEASTAADAHRPRPLVGAVDAPSRTRPGSSCKTAAFGRCEHSSASTRSSSPSPARRRSRASCSSGSGPIGVPLSEVYGMSESTGPMTWTPERIKPGTVGPAIPGCEVRLADDGEVICRGRQRLPGLPQRRRRRRPRRSTPTAGCTPATSASSTTTATSGSSTARRS